MNLLKAILAFAAFVALLDYAFPWGSPPPKREVPPVGLKPIEVLPTKKKVTFKITHTPETKALADRLFALEDMASKVAESSEFKERIMKAWWNGRPGFQDSNKSPSEVYADLYESGDITIEIEFRRHRLKSVTAWRQPPSNTIYFNTRNFQSRSDCAIVGTTHHENSHVKNYSHSSAKRTLSVPYYVGNQASIVCAGLSRKP